MLVLSILIGALGAGCQRSTDPPANQPAGTATGAESGAVAQPSAAPPPGIQAPAALGATASGGPAGEPAGAPVKPVPAVLPAVVATVNGENVQRWELETALKQAEANAGGPVPADRRDAVVRGILDELLMYHMLAQEARARKMDVSEAEVDTEMAAIRKDFPTEDAFRQALLLQGLTPEQLREVTRRAMQARKVIDAEITSKVAVQDAEVDAFYKENIDRFKQGDTVRVSHIYFAFPPNVTPTQKNQALAAAQDTLKQLKAGVDFAKLAKERSNDPSAANGGELPFFGRGDLPPDFENVAFGLKPGATSDVVELATGLHIVKLHEKRGPRTAPLAEVRENLKQFLMQGQHETRLDQLMGQLKAKTKIQILV
jgi:peptidyl-prolyl cis-trans isomerase C